MAKKKRKRRLNIGHLLILILGALIIGFGIRALLWVFDPIQLNAKEPTIQVNDKKYDPKDNIKFVFLGSKKDVKVSGTYNGSKVGDYKITYTYKNHRKQITFHVKDTQAPTLDVKDLKTDIVGKVTAKDFVTKCKDDSKVSLKIKSTKNLDTEGDHGIVIVAKDAYGNKTEKSVNLTRTKDKEAPAFGTMKTLKIKQGAKANYKKGIVVKDNYDANPKIRVNAKSIDMDKPGKYKITYTATDRSGNVSKKKRTVQIVKNDEYNSKVVYLTFDDGPSENTPRILKILKKNKIHATFFVTGYDPDYRKYIKEACDEGNTIGLHTYSHNYAKVYASVDSYFSDLQKVSDMVKGITGKAPKVIRFPGGSSNTISNNYSNGIMSKLVDQVHQKGYEYYDWNVSSGDAAGNNIPASTIVQSSTTISDDMDHVMILFHDSSTKDTTVEALPKIIRFYKDKGYKFMPITSDSEAIHHDVNN